MSNANGRWLKLKVAQLGVALVQRHSSDIRVAVKVETYADVYSDIMMWLYGGSLSHGKANQI